MFINHIRFCPILTTDYGSLDATNVLKHSLIGQFVKILSFD